MKSKKVIQIGLKDITKAGLEIKANKGKAETHHIIGNPNYELAKSKLMTRVLQFSLQEIEIPFMGPKNSLFNSIVSRRFASSDKVTNTLRDLVSQLTRLYHVSITERNQYVDVAIKRITKEHSLSGDDESKLRKEISFILNDGILKTFRDNVGRQIPVPDASAMAGIVTQMIGNLTKVLKSGKSLIDTDSLVQLVKSYVIVERRAHLSASEFDKRQIFDELTGMTTKVSKDPLMSLLIKNRMEYTQNAASQTIRMSAGKFSELINNPIIKITATDIKTQ